MNLYKLSFNILLILTLLGCSNELTVPGTDSSIEVTKEEVKNEAKANSNENSTQKNQKNFNELKKVTTDLESKVKISKYDMANGLCNIQYMTAPEYVDKEKIVFIEFGEVSRIVEFDRVNHTCKKIHEGIGIGSVVGLNKKVYWTEYDTSKMTNVEWKIKELDLLTYNTKDITNGESLNDTPTPVVRSGKNVINWIEYKQDGGKIVSQLKQYHQTDNKITVLEESVLDETDVNFRNGDYFIHQKAAKEGQALIFKSVFKKGEKSFDLSLYEKDKEPVFLTNDVNAIEFSIQDNHLAYGGEKRLSVVDTNTKQTLTYTSNHLTTDSPIFIDENKLVFREGMNEIFLIDIEKVEYFSISKRQNTISKPIWTNNYLAYGVYDTDENNKTKLEFNIIEFK